MKRSIAGVVLAVVAGWLALAIVTVAADRQQTMRVRPVRWLLSQVFRIAPGLKPRAQRAWIRLLYEVINRQGMAGPVAVMNYGYAPRDDAERLDLRPDEEVNRFGYQMYRAVAGAIDLAGKDVIEIGCGRGGGAAFVVETMGPRSLTGVDLAERAIAQCIEKHRDERLRFVQGDAEDLPAPAASFDAAINIESSHAYPNVGCFLAEAHRVLRPGGHLLLADFRNADEMAGLRDQVATAGFAIVEDERITEEVVRALGANARHMQGVVERSAPRLLRPLAREFVAAEGTVFNRGFRSGEIEYRRFVLRRD